MFTKLNRALLASGLALASAALLSPAAFADVTIQKILSGNIDPTFTFTWDYTPTPFTILSTGVITNQTLGTLTATGNVNYKIVGSSTKGGFLEGTTKAAKKIHYTLSFDNGAAIFISAVPLEEFNVTTALANANISAATLSLSSVGAADLTPQTYEDTLTLTTKANP